MAIMLHTPRKSQSEVRSVDGGDNAKQHEGKPADPEVSKATIKVVGDTLTRSYSDLDTKFGLDLSFGDLNEAASNPNLPNPVRASAKALQLNYKEAMALARDGEFGISKEDLKTLQLPPDQAAGQPGDPLKVAQKVANSFTQAMTELGNGNWVKERAAQYDTLVAATRGTSFEVSFTQKFPLAVSDGTFDRFSLTTNETFNKGFTPGEQRAINNWVNTCSFGSCPEVRIEVTSEGKVADVSVAADGASDPKSRTHEVVQDYIKAAPQVTTELLKQLESDIRAAIRKDIS